jgi:hypothetical protein
MGAGAAGHSVSTPLGKADPVLDERGFPAPAQPTSPNPRRNQRLIGVRMPASYLEVV